MKIVTPNGEVEEQGSIIAVTSKLPYKIIANWFMLQKYLQVKNLISRFLTFLVLKQLPLGAYFPLYRSL